LTAIKSWMWKKLRMLNECKILPINAAAPVVEMLSPEEEKLVHLLSTLVVEETLKQAYEESDSLPAVQS
jgi:hypothetical protein